MAEEKDRIEDSKEKPPAKKFSFKLIILLLIVVVLGAGGYMGWRFYGKGETEENKKESPAKDPKGKQGEVRINCPLETFIVNLMDNAGLGKRYLKAQIILEVGSEEARNMVSNYQPQLRDTILLLLSSQSFDEINTVDGKLELKQELLLRANQVFGKAIVQRVYFTDFVVQ